MIVLLTGSSGCVGRALLSELESAGHEIVTIGRQGTLAASRRSISCDLVEPFSCESFPTRVDAVIHLAQSRRYREFPAAAPEVFAINVAATQKLAEYALRAGAKSFLYASTGSLYVPNASPVREDAATMATSYYTASKIAAEFLASAYADVMAVGVLRLFYVFGPGQSKMLIDVLAERICHKIPVTLQGSGGIRVAPIFSADVARVFRAAAEHRWQGTYNVGSPDIYALREVAGEIGRVVGIEPRFEQLDGECPLTALPQLDKLATRFDLSTFTGLSRGLVSTFGPQDVPVLSVRTS